MEGYCSTGQSPQRAVVPVEEEEEEEEEEDGGWSTRGLRRFILRKKIRCPLHRWFIGSWGLSGWAKKILSPPGFDPLTTQPVASRCTECTTPAVPYNFPDTVTERRVSLWREASFGALLETRCKCHTCVCPIE
jgi:hypothetical protein